MMRLRTMRQNELHETASQTALWELSQTHVWWSLKHMNKFEVAYFEKKMSLKSF